MDARLEEVKTAVAKLQQERQRFWAQIDAKCLSMAELIDRFLEFTDTCMPEELDDIRLRTFAEDCYAHLGWSGTCQAYEHILAEDLGWAFSMYHAWTFFGMALMKDEENLSFEERVRVAADVESAYERAMQDVGSDWNNDLGYFYYNHPLKVQQPQVFLLKSKEWFERAIESDDFNECDHHDLQTLGHVFFELGDFENALHWYEKFAAVENKCPDGCVLDLTIAEKRLVECQQRLRR